MTETSKCAFEGLSYTIFDPTGNITALVDSDVAPAEQLAVAACIMEAHPEVEQVGFVRFGREARAFPQVQGELRMAGGEFCGNAAMCAAAFCLLSDGSYRTTATDPVQIELNVSGASEPVAVRLWEGEANRCRASVRMPLALAIKTVPLEAGGLAGEVPLVRMEGISHLVIEGDSPLFALRTRPHEAEQAVRMWCDRLGADGLGLMFLELGQTNRLTPLVFVPGGDTVFWESSCASGTSAVGMYLSAKAASAVDLTLEEPGGTLRVQSEPGQGETWLYGSVRAVGTITLS